MAEGYGKFSPDKREFLQCDTCERKLCKNCLKHPAQKAGQGKNGNEYFRPYCVKCTHNLYGVEDKRTNREKDPWKRLSLQIRQERNKCERCGFVPEHLGQLDVDHINADNKDNRPENLMVLCANCHRLKSILNKDWVKAKNAVNHL